MPRSSEQPTLDPTNHEASMLELRKWEVYPPDPYYVDDDGNDIEWVWHTARSQWLPEGYKVVEGQWVLDEAS